MLPVNCGSHADYQHFVVTNFPKSRIKSFQVYLNLLLESGRGDKLYKFTPIVKAPDSTQLRQFSNIVFADPTKKLKGKKKEEKIENAIKVFKCAEDLLKKIVEEIPDFQQMLDNKILSAQLLVKFTKPRKMD